MRAIGPALRDRAPLLIFERLSRAGARFVAANEGIDTDQPGSELTLDIMAAIVRQQWRRRQEIPPGTRNYPRDLTPDQRELLEACEAVALLPRPLVEADFKQASGEALDLLEARSQQIRGDDHISIEALVSTRPVCG